MPARRADRSDWPDFTASALREFFRLDDVIQDRFVAVFPEFVEHPHRPSPTLDVQPLRNDPHRWRLAIEGYRALFSVRSGYPLIEEIEPRTDRTYVRFGRLTSRRT